MKKFWSDFRSEYGNYRRHGFSRIKSIFKAIYVANYVRTHPDEF